MTSTINQNDCGCCDGIAARTPREIVNRHGLGAVTYRVGTHADFLDSMLAKLSSLKHPPLAGLRTRETDDFTIALLDAFATMSDVLTFYQQRIANESYLRTATERRSLLELARLIGYELRPGVAAGTCLAFTLEEAAGSPRRTTIDIGAKVQSIPGPGESPQTFETIEPIEARVEWNALRPQQTRLRLPVKGDDSLYLQGTTTNLKPGDMLLIVGEERELSPTSERWDARRVQIVEPDFDANRTRITVEQPLGSQKPPQSPPANPRVFALRQRASLFGHNAQPWSTLPVALRVGEILPGQTTVTAGPFARLANQWSKARFPKGKSFVHLDTVCNQVCEGGWFVLSTTSPTRYVELYHIRTVAEETHSQFNLTAKVTRLKFDGENIEKFAPSDSAVYLQSEELLIAETPLVDFIGGHEIHLDCAVEIPHLWTLAIRGIRPRVRVADKSSGLILRNSNGEQVRTLTRGDILTALKPPDPAFDTGTTVTTRLWRLQDDHEVEGFVTALDDELAVIAPARDGKWISEIATLDVASQTDPDHTTLKLKEPLRNYYDRRTVTINANVVRATHGETVSEVLGSGNAGQPFQKFLLRQPPLTFTSDASPSGAESTLRVYVNDLRWHEVSTLYGTQPRDRVFVTRTDDDRRTTVQFGDGSTGARPATGQENIKATYRKGIGLPGLVKAGQLSLLMTRPLGVKSVINPEDAAGAADRESRDDARANAPLTVLTIDRAVSLRDYENFTRAFAGIAKALATWVWDGRKRSVFLTIAGPDGSEVPEKSDLFRNLLAALAGAGVPNVAFRVQTFRKAQFIIVGGFRVDPDYLPDKVKANVDQALLEHFSFDARSFGQSVALSEVIAVIQAVDGVVMVDIDAVMRTTGEPLINGHLLAAMPDGEHAAELLMLAPDRLDKLKVIL